MVAAGFFVQQKAPLMAKKRGHGEGSISQRKDGTWQAIISVGHATTGKRIRKWVYGDTKREVTEKLTRLQNQKLDGQLLTRERLTVAELIDRWLTHWSPDLAASSRLRYRQMANRHINPHIGGMIVEKLQAIHIRALIDRLAEDGAGLRTQEYAFATIRRAMTMAVRLDLAAMNPCSKVEPPKSKPKPVDPPNAEKLSAILTAASTSPYYALFVLAATTGLRQGELFALSWDDIDLERGLLTVRHSLEEVLGRLAIKEPKSESGRRPVKLSVVAVDALHEHRKQQMASGKAGSPWLFTDTNGGFLRKSNFERRVWNPIRKEAGAENARFHDIRHSHTSLLLRERVPAKVIQHRLGHSTIKLTMDTYSHLMPDAQDEAALAIDRALKNGNSTDGGKLVVNPDSAAESPSEAIA